VSGWRNRSREVIRKVIADNQLLWKEPGRLFKLVSKAYPFGPRKHWPYKEWLAEVAKARDELANMTGNPNPFERLCGACGATPGALCKQIGTDDLQVVGTVEEVKQASLVYLDAMMEGRNSDAVAIALQCFHESRLARAKLITFGSGPLFGDAA